MPAKLTQEQWIEKAKAKHLGKFDYSLVEYVDRKTKVRIRCLACGDIFLQAPCNHTDGRGCVSCKYKKQSVDQSLTTEEFIFRSERVHEKGRYDYTLSVYVNSSVKVEIICGVCDNHFWQKPFAHMGGSGCPRCGYKRIAESLSMNTSEFIERAKHIHGDGKYDYSFTDYSGSGIKVSIKCNECGKMFEQAPAQHLAGQGCAGCVRRKLGESQRLTVGDFIRRSQDVHGNNAYDYGKVEYRDANTKVSILCNKCGALFQQKPSQHLWGYGCARCAGVEKKTTAEFAQNAAEVHGAERYDYSGAVYAGNKSKVSIKCNKCRLVFLQSPSDHLQGYGCPKCAIDDNARRHTHTTAHFIVKATERHGVDRYDYSNVKYEKAKSKVEVKCNACSRTFYQVAAEHLVGKGCPYCKESTGERVVAMVLDGLGVNYNRQHRFDGCKYRAKLPFDFYLPDHNICIEYHGRQHYLAINYFGGESGLKLTQKRDKIKERFCKENGIHLEVIPHWFTEDQVKTVIARIAHIQLALF